MYVLGLEEESRVGLGKGPQFDRDSDYLLLIISKSNWKVERLTRSRESAQFIHIFVLCDYMSSWTTFNIYQYTQDALSCSVYRLLTASYLGVLHDWLYPLSFSSSSKRCTNRPWSCSLSLKSRGRKGKQRKCTKGKWSAGFICFIPV